MIRRRLAWTTVRMVVFGELALGGLTFLSLCLPTGPVR